MATVYGLSSLSMAVTAAPDGRTGCLFGRDPVYACLIAVEVKIDHQKQIYDFAPSDPFNKNIDMTRYQSVPGPYKSDHSLYETCISRCLMSFVSAE